MLDEESREIPRYIDATEQLTNMHERFVVKQNLGAGNYNFDSSSNYLKFMDAQYNELRAKIADKQADYTNGAGPFANFDQAKELGIDPLLGVALRMGDKFQRLKSFCKQGELKVKDEGLKDVFLDLIGYSFIGLAMLQRKQILIHKEGEDDRWKQTKNP